MTQPKRTPLLAADGNSDLGQLPSGQYNSHDRVFETGDFLGNMIQPKRDQTRMGLNFGTAGRKRLHVLESFR